MAPNNLPTKALIFPCIVGRRGNKQVGRRCKPGGILGSSLKCTDYRGNVNLRSAGIYNSFSRSSNWDCLLLQ